MSNGEYNNFRVKGYTRPLSVIQLMLDARRKYSHMGVKNMHAMLIPQGEHNSVCTCVYMYLCVSVLVVCDGWDVSYAKYLFYVVLLNGAVVAEMGNAAVSSSIISAMNVWMQGDARWCLL